MLNVVQRSIVLCAVLLLSACATPTHTPYKYPGDSVKKLDVAFFDQQAYFCGPAALGSVLSFYGQRVAVDEIAKKVYSPNAKGSFAIEMGAAPRHWGFVSYPLPHSYDALIQEVNAGHPVLVLQNLGFSWWPQWHYATVIGFDPRTDEVIMHSGHNAAYRINRHTFRATWSRAAYWARVIVPPNQVPASAIALDYLNAINGLEQAGHKNEAVSAYETAAMRFPYNATAQLMTANALLTSGQAEAAHHYFIAALRASPKDATIWNNFAFALKESGCEFNAQRAISVAQELAPQDANILASAKELTKSDGAYVQRLSCPSISEMDSVVPR